MKKILYNTTVALGAIIIMASCKNNSTPATPTESSVVTPVPSSEYTAFKQWQQQQAAQPVQPAPVVVVHKHYVVERTTTAPAKKKGWSKAAKGTAIGAGAGAVTGAIISKNNRGLGAVIGGVVGGGVGYGVGRSKDKKDGRNE